jgi:hypothetical protein
MSPPAGWVGLLSDVGKRFEALPNGQATLHLYVTPTFDGFPPLDFPPQVREDRKNQVVEQGGFPAGSIYPDYSWYHLFANPTPPDHHYYSVLLAYRDRTTKLASEAWSILPADVRRLAFGATESAGWLVVAFRTLRKAGTGAVQWAPNMAWIEGDLAKASSLAIRALVREASAPVPAEPQSVAELAERLTKRTEWFRSFFADANNPLDLEYVQEINDLYGPPMPGNGDVLQLWAKGMVTRHLQGVLFNAHRWLDANGFTGQPAWNNEPINERWWFRANDHLSHLLNFLRSHKADPAPRREGAFEEKKEFTVSDQGGLTSPPQPTAELTAVERAIAVYLRDPDLSVSEVARQVGCDRSLLYRDERFKRLRKAHRKTLPKGSKSKEGDLEAEDER